jgi:hypothetical protein
VVVYDFKFDIYLSVSRFKFDPVIMSSSDNVSDSLMDLFMAVCRTPCTPREPFKWLRRNPERQRLEEEVRKV